MPRRPFRAGTLDAGTPTGPGSPRPLSAAAAGRQHRTLPISASERPPACRRTQSPAGRHSVPVQPRGITFHVRACAGRWNRRTTPGRSTSLRRPGRPRGSLVEPHPPSRSPPPPGTSDRPRTPAGPAREPVAPRRTGRGVHPAFPAPRAARVAGTSPAARSPRSAASARANATPDWRSPSPVPRRAPCMRWDTIGASAAGELAGRCGGPGVRPHRGRMSGARPEPLPERTSRVRRHPVLHGRRTPSLASPPRSWLSCVKRSYNGP